MLDITSQYKTKCSWKLGVDCCVTSLPTRQKWNRFFQVKVLRGFKQNKALWCRCSFCFEMRLDVFLLNMLISIEPNSVWVKEEITLCSTKKVYLLKTIVYWRVTCKTNLWDNILFHQKFHYYFLLLIISIFFSKWL